MAIHVYISNRFNNLIGFAAAVNQRIAGNVQRRGGNPRAEDSLSIPSERFSCFLAARMHNSSQTDFTLSPPSSPSGINGGSMTRARLLRFFFVNLPLFVVFRSNDLAYSFQILLVFRLYSPSTLLSPNFPRNSTRKSCSFFRENL